MARTTKVGTTSDHIGYFGDVMATLAELASADAPANLDSISFVPTITGKPQAQQQHPYLYWEFYEQGGRQAVRSDDGRSSRRTPPLAAQGCEQTTSGPENTSGSESMKNIISCFASLTTFVLTTFVLTTFMLTTPAGANERPNVLLILVDDLKPALGCYGDPHAKSPNIDRLAASGIRFDLAYCNQAVCAPSRFTLMLGAHSTSTGLYGLGSNLRESFPAAVTMPQYFAQPVGPAGAKEFGGRVSRRGRPPEKHLGQLSAALL